MNSLLFTWFSWKGADTSWWVQVWFVDVFPLRSLGSQSLFKIAQNQLILRELRTVFWEWDEDSNFCIFRVRQFIEWPGPLH